MKQIFFVTSYPRSRTAWLANLFTWGDSFCFHDGLFGCASLDEFYAKLQNASGDIVGNSDSGMLLFHEALMERFPQAKWIVVKRPIEECAASFEKVTGLSFDQHALFEKMEALIEKLRLSDLEYRIVPHHFLDRRLVICELLVFLNILMRENRVLQLMDMNIQLQPWRLKNIPRFTVEKTQRLQESVSRECVLA